MDTLLIDKNLGFKFENYWKKTKIQCLVTRLNRKWWQNYTRKEKQF